MKALELQLSELQLQRAVKQSSQQWNEVVKKRKSIKGDGLPKNSSGVYGPLQTQSVIASSRREVPAIDSSSKKLQRKVGNEKGRHAHPYRKIQVEGARCVWGTVKSATSVAVKSTNQQLSTIPGEDILGNTKMLEVIPNMYHDGGL